MKKWGVIAGLVTALSFTFNPVIADDRVDHFKGLQAQNLSEAFAHISDYNQQLQELLNADLTPEAILQVHELTYTLENALERLETELDAWAEQLEELHLASEKFDAEAVKTEGDAYLSLSEQWQRWGNTE
ncbi:MAG: hypothetical protein JJU48_01880 [Methylophaga sp.]|nr:hypothetical protein [Methylophaga sp.]